MHLHGLRRGGLRRRQRLRKDLRRPTYKHQHLEFFRHTCPPPPQIQLPIQTAISSPFPSLRCRRPACMNPLRIGPLASVRLPLSTLCRHHHHPRPTPQIALALSTSALTMAPPKAALDFVDFINASPTPYHAVATAIKILAKAGFQQIHERDSWAGSVRAGGKYYVTRNGSSIAAFAVGHEWRAGNPVAVVGAHTDSCCLRLKPVSKKSQVGYDQIAVEKYGGGIWTSWFDRDLSLAGRLLVRQAGGAIVPTLVKIDRPLVRIPTLAIHLHRQSGFDPNLETEMLPITALAEQQLNKAPANAGRRRADEDGDDDEDFQPLADMADRHHPAVLDVIASEAGVSVDAIVDFEMMLYDTQDACVGGLNDEFIFAPRLDNLEMTYCSIEGLVASVRAKDALDNDNTIRMAVCFDHEEIGSTSAQGAHSNMLPAVLRRLAVLPGSSGSGSSHRDAHSDRSYEHVSSDASGEESSTAFEQTLARSFLVSADMAHAVHPNYIGKYEAAHQPAMNKGTVIKVNASQKYATNSPGIVLLQECARAAAVPLQLFVVRNDSLCGSTIGPGLAALLGVRTIDVGNAQLSMHSIRETSGTADIGIAIKLFEKFFSTYGVMEPKILID
ncbi:aspartyl aminopeptidase [Cordyceps militaris]|uniref:aspartyl aminopeptidase n=1 Tax=Cordyceps militaris TaxID=73501 RepID=A0A2H4SD04_CORMI|nr:aspartyl aminopeptidase [Cordyceps militaris]